MGGTNPGPGNRGRTAAYGFYHLKSCVSSSQAPSEGRGAGYSAAVFESKARLQEDVQRLVEALRELGEGRYASLFEPGRVLLESPPDPLLRELVEGRVDALFRLPAALRGEEEMADLFEHWREDEFFLAFLNGRVGILVACPDAKGLEDESGELLKILADRLLRLNASWRLDERGRGLFFGSPRLDTVVIGRASG